MSAYPPPNEFNPIFNESEYNTAYIPLTQAAADLRYLRLSGGIEQGLVTFNAGLQTANIYNAGFTFSMPSASGQLCLVSQLPSSLDFVDLTTNQTAAGNKTWSDVATFNNTANFNGLTAIGPTGSFSFSSGSANALLQFTGLSNVTLTFPTSTGTLALVSQIPTSSTYVDLTTNQTVAGIKTFSDKIIAANTTAALQFHPSITSVLASNGGGDLLIETNSVQAALISATSGSTFNGPIAANSAAIAAGGLTVSGNFALPSTYLTGASIRADAATLNDTASSGTVAQLSDISLGIKTITAASATTYTNATALQIAGPPVASTNATMTNRYALQIDSGDVLLTNGKFISVAAGTVGAPAYSFAGTSSGTGIYAPGANSVAVTVSSSQKLTVTTASVTSTLQVRSSLAAAAASPQYSATADTTSGFYVVSSGNVGISASSTQITNYTSTRAAVMVAGSAGTPSLGFGTSDTGTGWYRPGANQIGCAVSGVNVSTVSSTGLAVSGLVSATTLKAGTSGTTVATGIQFGSITSSTVVTAGSNADIGTITLSGFGSIPNVVLTMAQPSGGANNWDRCILSINTQSSTSTSIVVTAVNTGASSTSSTCRIYWMAFA